MATTTRSSMRVKALRAFVLITLEDNERKHLSAFPLAAVNVLVVSLVMEVFNDYLCTYKYIMRFSP